VSDTHNIRTKIVSSILKFAWKHSWEHKAGQWRQQQHSILLIIYPLQNLLPSSLLF